MEYGITLSENPRASRLTTVLQVRDISNSLREYSSTVGILSSAFHVREHVVQLLCLFCINASFVEDVYDGGQNVADAAALLLEPASDLELFPMRLEMLSEELKLFQEKLSEISEFSDDEAITKPIAAFRVELEVSLGYCF